MLKKLSIPHYLFLLLLASTWVVYNQHGSINDDGGLYIRQAYFFAQGDFKRAISLFNWPLFGFLIGSLHQLTNIPILYAAHTIDIVCFLIASLFFLKTLVLICKDKNIMLAGFLVIITSLPLIDDYLAMVLRDHGMWAGFMAGVYYFITWHRTPTLINAFAWQAGFLIGALFRPEVLIFNLILPVFTIFNPPKNQTKTLSFIKSISLILIGLVLLVTFEIYQAAPGNAPKLNLGRLPELYERPLALVNQIYTPLPVQSSDVYLKSIIEHYPLVFKFGFLLSVVFYKWIVAMGLFNLAAIYTALKYKLISNPDFKIIKTLFFITIIVSSASFFHIFVDTNRYWFNSYLLAYLIAAFGFLYWIKKISGLKYPIKFFFSGLLTLIVFVYIMIGLFDSKPHYPQELEVIDWLKRQDIGLEKVYFNDRRLIIYAQRYEIEGEELSDALQKQPDYIVLRATQLQDIQEIPSAYQQIMKFSLEGKVRFIVYKKQ